MKILNVARGKNMNRKAKRNKFRNETAKLNIEIKTLKYEKDNYINKWCISNAEKALLQLKLDKSEKDVKKYQEKYYEQLKKEFLDGSKQLLTVSVNVPKDIIPYTVDEKIIEQERRKCLCHDIAEYLYDNQQAFQTVEHESYTRYNLVLVQNNPNKKGISKEDFDNMMNMYNNPCQFNDNEELSKVGTVGKGS